MDETATIEEAQAYRRRIGHLGGTATREAHGTGFLRKIAGHGGRTTKARHGREHYARIGRKGNRAAYENWLETKKAEAKL